MSSLKLDYERYQSRVDALRNKSKRSDRENTALTKHEADLVRTTEEYQVADEHLRSVLPGLINAVFSLVPQLLATQIEIQNTLLGHVYTSLQNYCVDHGFPSPPPEPDEVVGPWEAEFTSLRLELEGGFQMLAGGKAIHQPMRQPDKSGTVTGLNIRNTVMGRRQNSQTSTKSASAPKYNVAAPAYEGPSAPSIDSGSKPKIGGLNASKPKIGSYSPNASAGSLTPYEQTTTPSPRLSSTSLSSQGDYFTRPRIPSAASSSHGSGVSPGIGKKKPPPPPPKKIGSFQSEYVTAMYDFAPINEGDLAFKEGDRIRVTKKTQSSQDWWEGEVHGQRGSFPANYCK
jgi:amphiphysin